mgnify:CR=1 FL=1
MEKSLDITKGQIAFLAGIAYLGLAVTALFVSTVMVKFTAKSVLIMSAFGNAVACFVFARQTNFTWLVLSRFVLGAFQAFFFCYAPVWINHFAPRSSASTWLSLQ